MVRLPADHQLRDTCAYALWRKIQALPATNGLFREAVQTRSGFALIPLHPLPRPITLAVLGELEGCLEAETVEFYEEWSTFLLEPIPWWSAAIAGLHEGGEISLGMVCEEVHRLTGVAPCRAAWT
jgi:hypothetical protein